MKSYNYENSKTRLIELLRPNSKSRYEIPKGNDKKFRGMSELISSVEKNIRASKLAKKSEDHSRRITEENHKHENRQNKESSNDLHNSKKTNIKNNFSQNISYHQNYIKVNFNRNGSYDKNVKGVESHRSSSNNNYKESSCYNLKKNINSQDKKGISFRMIQNVNNALQKSNFVEFERNSKIEKNTQSKENSSNRLFFSSIYNLNRNLSRSNNDSENGNNVSFDKPNKGNGIDALQKNSNRNNFYVENNERQRNGGLDQSNNFSSNSINIENKKSNNSLLKNANSSSNFKTNLAIDSPEELHFFYVQLFNQNKSYAYKFENEKYNKDLEIHEMIEFS